MPLNPTILKKEDQILTMIDNIKQLFQIIYREKNKIESGDEVPKIRVSELISKMSFYYEKLRNAVEYREEHLLRKNAILRTLKRKALIEGAFQSVKAVEVAKNLLVELIRATYLPNNKIPESKIEEVGAIIEKYLKLKDLTPTNALGKKEKKEIVNWILAICASEIEDTLCTSQITETVVNQMCEILKANIKLPVNSPFTSDKEIQIYLAIHRLYLKFDREMLEYILLKYFNPSWSTASQAEISKLAEKLTDLRLALDRQINHPLQTQFDRIVRRYTIYFNLLRDTIEEDPVGLYESFREDPKAFARVIKKHCNKRYKAAKTKLRRAAIRSIIYIFLTKMILALLLEVPATIWFGDIVNYLSLAINVTFPPFLLFLIVLFTRVPSEANSEKIVEGVEEIVFLEKQRKEPIELRPPIKRSAGLSAFFGILYSVTFFVSFGLVVWLLNKIHFNSISIIIFIFFLTLVSFFGWRIRKGARELFIVEHKENIISLLVDFFYVPIIAAGKWLNEKFSHLNFFVFILDFIIEAPFKVFVEIAEDWTRYVRERKEEIM